MLEAISAPTLVTLYFANQGLDIPQAKKFVPVPYCKLSLCVTEQPLNIWCYPSIDTMLSLYRTVCYPPQLLNNPSLTDVSPQTTRCYPCTLLNNPKFTGVVPPTTLMLPSYVLYVIPLNNWTTSNLLHVIQGGYIQNTQKNARQGLPIPNIIIVIYQ